MTTGKHDIIGLIPAAGLARRLAPLTGSKEVLPIGSRLINSGTITSGAIAPQESDEGSAPRVVCEYLLEHMKKGGINRAYLVLRDGKWDIPDTLGDGSRSGINLAYLIMGLPYGPPFTLDQAYPFVRQHTVALGFPDILFESDDAYARLIATQADTNADVVLGLFPADQPRNVDMVDVDDDLSVRHILIKPSDTTLEYTWGIAVWTPAFTDFMHGHLAKIQKGFKSGSDPKQELHVGDVIQAAIDHGLRVLSVKISDQPYIDIGNPENLQKVRTTMGKN